MFLVDISVLFYGWNNYYSYSQSFLKVPFNLKMSIILKNLTQIIWKYSHILKRYFKYELALGLESIFY